ncbi:MAG: hypothetical protein DRR42_09080 [Gammaproteobacteria bacterium]|nr:MAG: hypothetical protein DRR42_09080 [Gammaproteobacteria bacterium]
MKHSSLKLFALLTLLITSIVLPISAIAQYEEIIYYHNDALGSPIVATDANGDVKWREEYSPYGSRLLHESREVDAGTDAQIESPWDEKQWFTGKIEETGVGIQYFGARWYEPELGRFLSPDPVQFTESNIFSFNRYAYGNNNPYRYVDPDGNNPKLIADFILNVSLNYVTTGRPNFVGAAKETALGAWNPLKTLKTVGKLTKAVGSKVTKSAGQLGREGEAAASAITGVGKNTKIFPVNGRNRIPDQVNGPQHLTEVKNVKSQSYTRQLRDNVDLVGGVGGGGRADVFVRGSTKISGPLQKAHDNPLNPINIRKEL